MSKLSPVFIVGAERSGSTLFRLMLDAHPSMTVCSEFEYAVDPIADGRPWPKKKAWQELKNNWIFQDHRFGIDERLSWPQLMRSFLDQQSARDGGDAQVMAVVHRNFDQLPRIWPSARYIHIVRDPRDVARSAVQMGWGSDVWTTSERWVHAEECWDRLGAMVNGHHLMTIQQEDLLNHPEDTLTKVCEFMELPYDPKMLTYSQNTSYEAPNPALAHQWMTQLNDDEIARVEYRVGRRLLERGYLPSGVTPVKPSYLKQLSIVFKDWWARSCHRRQLYGTPLFIEDWLARKLHLTHLQERVASRMHYIWRGSLR